MADQNTPAEVTEDTARQDYIARYVESRLKSDAGADREEASSKAGMLYDRIQAAKERIGHWTEDEHPTIPVPPPAAVAEETPEDERLTIPVLSAPDIEEAPIINESPIISPAPLPPARERMETLQDVEITAELAEKSSRPENPAPEIEDFDISDETTILVAPEEIEILDAAPSQKMQATSASYPSGFSSRSQDRIAYSEPPREIGSRPARIVTGSTPPATEEPAAPIRRISSIPPVAKPPAIEREEPSFLQRFMRPLILATGLAAAALGFGASNRSSATDSAAPDTATLASLPEAQKNQVTSTGPSLKEKREAALAAQQRSTLNLNDDGKVQEAIAAPETAAKTKRNPMTAALADNIAHQRTMLDVSISNEQKDGTKGLAEDNRMFRETLQEIREIAQAKADTPHEIQAVKNAVSEVNGIAGEWVQAPEGKEKAYENAVDTLEKAMDPEHFPTRQEILEARRSALALNNDSPSR